MPVVVALICSLAVVGLAAFQIALLLGAPWARFAWGGEDHYLQPRFRGYAMIAVAVYVLAILVVLQGANIFLWVPVLVSQIATYVFSGIFFAAFVATATSRSAVERRVMLPVNVILAALFLIVAVTGHA